MIVHIKDIPQEGKDIEFEVSIDSLNARINASSDLHKDSTLVAPEFIFQQGLQAKVSLYAEGLTIIAHGGVEGYCLTKCSRCMADARLHMSHEIDWVLKPSKIKEILPDEEEDISYGTHDGKIIDCSVFVEEQLILNLPFAPLCSESCKGICLECGNNFNETENCGDDCPRLKKEAPKPEDERMAFFRQFKIQ